MTNEEEKRARQVAALRELMVLILDAVKAAGKRGLPSGHLYASVMQVVNLETYNTLIRMLEKAGKLSNSGHLLHWKADLDE